MSAFVPTHIAPTIEQAQRFYMYIQQRALYMAGGDYALSQEYFSIILRMWQCSIAESVTHTHNLRLLHSQSPMRGHQSPLFVPSKADDFRANIHRLALCIMKYPGDVSHLERYFKYVYYSFQHPSCDANFMATLPEFMQWVSLRSGVVWEKEPELKKYFDLVKAQYKISLVRA